MLKEEIVIRRIDHVAIAVRDQEKARSFFVDILGGRELFCAPAPGQGFRWTTIELGTSCFIELIDPTDQEGFAHRFLETRGEGPHHITIQVDDLEKVHNHLEDKGVPTFGYSEPFPGWKEFFIHPKNAFGTLIQFAEFHPLEWIEPGYVPPSYWEFATPLKLAGGDEIQLGAIKEEGGWQVELRRGGETLRIPRAVLPELITALRKHVEDEPSR
jgi:methylmalonyl-CoA/ethylmalonyl-CoA epimerase